MASSLPSALVEVTRHSAALLLAAAGSAGISVNVQILLKGAMRAMTIAKIRTAATLAVALMLSTGGVGTLVYRLHAQPALAAPIGGEQDVRAGADAVDKAAEADARQRQAEDLLQREQADYRMFERRWTEDLVAARLKQIQAEDALRRLDREHDADREREKRAESSCEPAIARAEDQLEAAQKALRQLEASGTAANIRQPRDAMQRVVADAEAKQKLTQRKLRELIDGHRQREQERSDARLKARVELVEAEEQLRRVEREQAVQRELAVSRLAQAADRVRQAEVPSAGDEAGRDVERKLDRLLREIGDLRRALDQRSDKRRGPLPD